MRRSHIFGILVIVLLVLAACGKIESYHAGTTPGPGESPTSPVSSPASTMPPSGDAWSPNDPWSLPNPRFGSGSTTGGGTFSQVCPHVDPSLEAARPTTAEKAAIYHEYGLSYPQPYGNFELDHIIPIELGGAPDSQQNLFPERNSAPDPAMDAKWHLSSAFVHNRKDTLEDALHQLVCSGKVDLALAQHDISTDWVSAYHTYVEGMNP